MVALSQHAGRFLFVHSCPGSTYEDMRPLIDNERTISRKSFALAIGTEQWRSLQHNLGYDRWLPISKDWHVGYYRSVYRGVPAVFLRHSHIEYIYTLDGQLGPSEATRPHETSILARDARLPSWARAAAQARRSRGAKP